MRLDRYLERVQRGETVRHPRKLWMDPRLLDLWYYFWQVNVPTSYVGLGGSPTMISAPFLGEEDEQQGAVESALLFTFGINNANNLTNNELRLKGAYYVWG